MKPKVARKKSTTKKVYERKYFMRGIDENMKISKELIMINSGKQKNYKINKYKRKENYSNHPGRTQIKITGTSKYLSTNNLKCN
jgi:hypothetical protein